MQHNIPPPEVTMNPQHPPLQQHPLLHLAAAHNQHGVQPFQMQQEFQSAFRGPPNQTLLSSSGPPVMQPPFDSYGRPFLPNQPNQDHYVVPGIPGTRPPYSEHHNVVMNQRAFHQITPEYIGEPGVPLPDLATHAPPPAMDFPRPNLHKRTFPVSTGPETFSPPRNPPQEQQRGGDRLQHNAPTTSSALGSVGGSGANPNLYVHNVPKDANEAELRELFGRYGSIVRVRLRTNQKVGPRAVYAFITFSSVRDAENALQKLQGWQMRNRVLRVEFQRGSYREDDDGDEVPPSLDREGAEANQRQSGRGAPQQQNSRNGRLRSRSPAQRRALLNSDEGNKNWNNSRQNQSARDFQHENKHHRNSNGNNGSDNYNHRRRDAPPASRPKKLFLYEAVRSVWPKFFVRFEDEGPHSRHAKSQVSHFQPLSASPDAFSPVSEDGVSPSRDEFPLVLKRNERKPLHVFVKAISGHNLISKILRPNDTLKITRRCSFDGVSKNPMQALCVFRPASRDRFDVESFMEYLSYFATKQKVGVVTFESDNYVLCIVPSGHQLFYQFVQPTKEQHDLRMLGVLSSGIVRGSSGAGQSAHDMPPHLTPIHDQKHLGPASVGGLRPVDANLSFSGGPLGPNSGLRGSNILQGSGWDV